jgi:hypothetical protein
MYAVITTITHSWSQCPQFGGFTMGWPSMQVCLSSNAYWVMILRIEIITGNLGEKRLI